MTSKKGFDFKDGVTLKEHFNRRFEDLEKMTELSRLAMEKRLDGMNEFRDALKDQSAKSPTRDEMTSEFDSIKKDIRLLISFKDTQQGRASQEDVNKANRNSFIGMSLGSISLLLAIIKFFGG